MMVNSKVWHNRLWRRNLSMATVASRASAGSCAPRWWRWWRRNHRCWCRACVHRGIRCSGWCVARDLHWRSVRLEVLDGCCCSGVCWGEKRACVWVSSGGGTYSCGGISVCMCRFIWRMLVGDGVREDSSWLRWRRRTMNLSAMVLKGWQWHMNQGKDLIDYCRCMCVVPVRYAT